MAGDDDDNQKTISTEPYNYKNTLVMRSKIWWNDELSDLPSLISFKGNLMSFERIGSVILESSGLVVDWSRHSSAVWRNSIQWSVLLQHLFPPILKYSFSPFITIRCYCSRISYQKQNQVPLVLFFCIYSILITFIATHESLNNQFTDPVTINWEYSLNSSLQQSTIPYSDHWLQDKRVHTLPH